MQPTIILAPLHLLFIDLSGVPGGAPMLILLLIAATLIAYRLASWVYTDAQENDDTYALGWALLTALGVYIALIPGLFVMLLYVVQRNARKSSSPGS